MKYAIIKKKKGQEYVADIVRAPENHDFGKEKAVPGKNARRGDYYKNGEFVTPEKQKPKRELTRQEKQLKKAKLAYKNGDVEAAVGHIIKILDTEEAAQ